MCFRFVSSRRPEDRKEAAVGNSVDISRLYKFPRCHFYTVKEKYSNCHIGVEFKRTHKRSQVVFLPL